MAPSLPQVGLVAHHDHRHGVAKVGPEGEEDDKDDGKDDDDCDGDDDDDHRDGVAQVEPGGSRIKGFIQNRRTEIFNIQMPIYIVFPIFYS